jgi:hypothetical protein
MCDACEAKREAKVLAAAITLLATIDYKRLEYFFATVNHSVDVLRRSIEEQGELEGIPLDALFSDEDELHRGLKVSMKLAMMCDDFIHMVDDMMVREGPIAIPTDGITPNSLEAFQTFIDNELKIDLGDDHDEV